MNVPHECHSIEEVRQQIDEIDQKIIDLIGNRFAYIPQIVRYKNNADEVYAKDRHLAVLSQRRIMASDHHLDPDVIEQMYRILMDYFIKEQVELIKNKQK